MKESRSLCSLPLSPRFAGVMAPAFTLEVRGVEARPTLLDRHAVVYDGDGHPLADGETRLAPRVRAGVGGPHLFPLGVVAAGSGRATLRAVGALALASMAWAARA